VLGCGARLSCMGLLWASAGWGGGSARVPQPLLLGLWLCLVPCARLCGQEPGRRGVGYPIHALAKAPAEEPLPSILSSVRDACTILAQRVHGTAVRVQLLARELWTARKTGANTASIAAALSRIAHLPTHTQTATPQGGAYGVAEDEPLRPSCPSAQPRHSIPEPAYTAEGVDADQLLYARPMHRQGTVRSMQDAAFLFNKIAQYIPECICACCQELHWRSQMQTCRLATLSRSPVQSLAAHFIRLGES
jgi:hypothetical protein